MKKVIIIFSLCIASIFTVSAQDCDTLKWKISNTIYSKSNSPTSLQKLGTLQDAVINMDTLSRFFPGYDITNISSDTFFVGETFSVLTYCQVYTDTGLFDFHFYFFIAYDFSRQMPPNTSASVNVVGYFDFVDMINALQVEGLNFEQITHWQVVNMLGHTSKDGYYSNNVIYLGADTATFHVVKTPPPSILESTQTEISVFPNPAQSQFTVTNTENANLTLYNVLGQQVKQVIGEGENTIIHTEGLPQGIYLLKVEKEGAVLTKKIQIND